MAGFQSFSALIARVLGYAEDIPTVLNQALGQDVSSETGGTLTTDGNEQNIYVNDAPAGVQEPRCVKVDFTNHTVAETIVLREYYRIKSGGNFIEQDAVTYVGLVSPELIKVDLDPNRFGVKVTIEKTAGGNKAYDWAVFYEV